MSRSGRARAILWAALGLAAAGPSAAAGEELLSLAGGTLAVPEPSAALRERQESLLTEALRARDAEPSDPDAWIWVGRRQAYLGRYAEAVATFTEGLERFPGDARFLRHRGHRLITQRRLEEAVEDLERAAALVDGLPDEIEPDGLPNDRGIPTSTLQTNIWYHLGLARYLRGEWGPAVAAFERCRDLSANPDMLVAATYWLVLSRRRNGEKEAAERALARIGDDLDIIENDGYYDLLRAFAGGGDGVRLMESAEVDRAAVSYPTTAYGVGAWALVNGDVDRARRTFERIVESTAVAAFGYIAAEAELARGLGTEPEP